VRAYLAGAELDAARAGLRALMDRVADRRDLEDERAMVLAVDEVHDVRASRRGRRSA
jgi:divalent metal cation (Fe/Co/Zn/Cd) transporter